MKYQTEGKDRKHTLEIQEGSCTIDGQHQSFEFHQFTSQDATIRLNDQLHKVRFLERSEDGKTLKAVVNGKVTEITLKSETDLLLEKMGGGAANNQSAKKIKAPMPGLIVKIQVEIGQEVEKGQVLLNFEAMKMENQLKSPGPGKVKTILVTQGDKVEKGQLLVEME